MLLRGQRSRIGREVISKMASVLEDPVLSQTLWSPGSEIAGGAPLVKRNSYFINLPCRAWQVFVSSEKLIPSNVSNSAQSPRNPT
jgi:hypothetical protein